MVVAVVNFFGLSLAEVVIFAGFVGWLVSMIRDWRPMKAMRQENRDLRDALERAEARFDDYKRESEKRINALTDELGRLKRATNLSPLQDTQKETTKVLQTLVAEVKSLDGDVKANTAAVETLSKRRIIDEALDERNDSE